MPRAFRLPEIHFYGIEALLLILVFENLKIGSNTLLRPSVFLEFWRRLITLVLPNLIYAKALRAWTIFNPSPGIVIDGGDELDVKPPSAAIVNCNLQKSGFLNSSQR